MILTTHDFGSHVTWSARGLLRVIRVPDTSNPEVGDVEVSSLIKDQVLWFDVPMNNTIVVNIL